MTTLWSKSEPCDSSHANCSLITRRRAFQISWVNLLKISPRLQWWILGAKAYNSLPLYTRHRRLYPLSVRTRCRLHQTTWKDHLWVAKKRWINSQSWHLPCQIWHRNFATICKVKPLCLGVASRPRILFTRTHPLCLVANCEPFRPNCCLEVRLETKKWTILTLLVSLPRTKQGFHTTQSEDDWITNLKQEDKINIWTINNFNNF